MDLAAPPSPELECGMTFDPVKLELIRHGLEMISDNMMVSVVRTARSTLVKNNLDFSGSICDADGNMVAQGLALPSHLGAIMPALRGCLDYFGDDIGPGDILATNDPYSGGSHLNDIFMFKPVYSSDTRVCILALILHHTDLGGRVAGGRQRRNFPGRAAHSAVQNHDCRSTQPDPAEPDRTQHKSARSGYG